VRDEQASGGGRPRGQQRQADGQVRAVGLLACQPVEEAAGQRPAGRQQPGVGPLPRGGGAPPRREAPLPKGPPGRVRDRRLDGRRRLRGSGRQWLGHGRFLRKEESPYVLWKLIWLSSENSHGRVRATLIMRRRGPGRKRVDGLVAICWKRQTTGVGG